MKTWTKILGMYNYGDLVEGIVVSHRDFGVFLDIGEEGVFGLIEIIHFDGIMSQDEYPPVGSKVVGVIVAFAEDNRQIRLSAKQSHIADAHNW